MDAAGPAVLLPIGFIILQFFQERRIPAVVKKTKDQEIGERSEKPASTSLIHRFAKWLHSSHCRNTVLVLLSGLIIYGLYCLISAPKQYDLTVGSISRDTINATKDVVDEVTTEERRQAAANAVEPTYRFQEGVKEEVLSSLNAVFSELRTVQQYAQTLLSENGSVKPSFSDAEVEYAQTLVSLITLNRYQITTLLRTRSDAFEDMVSTVTTAVENTLNTTIREGQVNQSIQTILQIVGFKLDVSLTQNIVPTVLRSCLKPNMVIEQEATDLARKTAMDSVEPIVYLQGQNIIRAGDRITRSKLEMLRALGLLKNDNYDFSGYSGAALLVLIAMVSYVLSLRMVQKDVLFEPRKLLVVMIVTILGIGFSIFFHLYFSAYFVPMTFVPILLSALLGSRAGFASVPATAILLSGLAAGNGSTYLYEMILLFLMTLSGGIITVRFMKSHSQRIRVMLAGLISAAVNGLSILAIRWMTSTETSTLMASELWAMGGGLLSGVLSISLQPVFETVFRLPTPSKLTDLCNPNQSLLRRLQLEAPGTYHHALIVANLAEAAAEQIGANPYLARASALYHDIGKLKRPQYFVENQMGENPHTTLDPYISAAILTSHPKDGYQMALREHMPQEVADIILQHHGDTPVMYFYHKALQMSNGSPVDISDFRYDGPRPNTREAAIVMLADTIEAAVRSMPDPTPKAIEQFIERLVRGKLEDGQLSDSPITLRDIDEICAAFFSVLRGVFHERIEYPEVNHRVPEQLFPVPKGNAQEKNERAASGQNHQMNTPHAAAKTQDTAASFETSSVTADSKIQGSAGTHSNSVFQPQSKEISESEVSPESEQQRPSSDTAVQELKKSGASTELQEKDPLKEKNSCESTTSSVQRSTPMASAASLENISVPENPAVKGGEAL